MQTPQQKARATRFRNQSARLVAALIANQKRDGVQVPRSILDRALK
jgi:hypothetical protein